MTTSEENHPSSSQSEKTQAQQQQQDPQDESIDFENIPRKRYFFGLQGRSLRRNISIAGSIGFLLFGYDQGVLSVRPVVTA